MHCDRLILMVVNVVYCENVVPFCIPRCSQNLTSLPTSTFLWSRSSDSALRDEYEECHLKDHQPQRLNPHLCVSKSPAPVHVWTMCVCVCVCDTPYCKTVMECSIHPILFFHTNERWNQNREKSQLDWNDCIIFFYAASITVLWSAHHWIAWTLPMYLCAYLNETVECERTTVSCFLLYHARYMRVLDRHQFKL